MNKLGIILGAAAVMVVAGCQDPNYVRKSKKPQNEVKQVPSAEVTPVLTNDVKPVAPETPVTDIVSVDIPVTPATPSQVAELPGAPAAAEKPAVDDKDVTTPYIVQRGDYLAKISKKFNVKLDALRKANPQLKNDVVRLGQTIQIPGKVDVGEQTIPEGAIAKSAKKAKAEYKPYSGETKEYVVKAGDYLGKIAAASKISVRQLKELNGLETDVIRIGQKLRIPATTVAAAVAAAPAAAPDAAKVETPKADGAPVAAPKMETPVVETPAPVAAPEVAPVAPAAPAAADDVFTYVVQDGEDIISLSISFGVDPAVIRELNNMGEMDQVKAGQVIKLPQEAN